MASAAPARVQPDAGLDYLFGRDGPARGALIPIADGVGWARLPIPGSLKHINVWALDDGDDIAIVDTGLNIAACREGWEALFEGPLAGRKVTRVIVTHFHPDHCGLAGWLCARFGATLWMNRTEFLIARLAMADVRDTPPEEVMIERRAAGWSDAQLEIERGLGWGRFAQIAAPLPIGHVPIGEGDLISVGARSWRVMTGGGHTPEHCSLVDEAGGLMISGDQILPRISSNVSTSSMEPHGDPLGDWLATLDRFERDLAADIIVLPAHGEPFRGAGIRLSAITTEHFERLDALEAFLRTEPRRAVDCFSILFGREIDESVFALASGEAMAHLRRLEITGRATRVARDGVWWFSA